ncbi:pilus assembly protein [Stenotrophomonas tuberculopleuritidis]|uniref:pilus assembly protein n=1 Tax=Stenotrophomonas tuberculopleuritidis TaxID=3055079 RepID=UPI0026E50B1A|nr:PilC/PilY family type IV pilus protein [Stenotrophomonas sp. 704A1]
MASRRTRWMAAGSVGLLAAGGWLAYSLLAAPGHGTLAQAPLNIQTQTPPAFLMALDDSGSMLWEVLNNTRDGVYRWNTSTSSGRIVGFYNSGGKPYGFDEGTGLNYYYLTPSYGRSDVPALPPLDAYGFARSPDVNTAYFDPRDTYPDWKTGIADRPSYMAINPRAARLDPRPEGTDNTRTTATQNLTVQSTRRDNDGWRFAFRSSMIIPIETLIESGRCGATDSNTSGKLADNRTDTPTGFRRVTRAITVPSSSYNYPNGRNQTPDRCLAGVGYYPATFYLADPTTLPADYGYRDSARVKIDNPTHGRPGTLYKYEIREGNFASTAQYNAAMQNFANWFSFYRTRRESLIGAATNALHDTTNLRVGWFRINNRRNVTMFDMTDEAQKSALLTDIMRDMRASGSTPNRSAAQYLGQEFQRTGADAPVLLSCQKNAGMLFTDGYINESGNRTLMRELVAPFYDSSLVPTLETNAVPVPSECDGANPDPSLDCKKNLHMNFYGVTLGTLGEEFGVKYLPEADRPWVVKPNPYTTPPTFPTSTKDLQPAAVDELWDAVLYTKGEMVNATRPAEITAAMRRIISNVAQGNTPSGSRSLTGARIGTGSLSVEPFYEATNNGTDWYSLLRAYALSVDPTTRKVVSTEAWEASNKLPAPAARNIHFWNNGALSEFTGNNVSLAALCSLSSSKYPAIKICSESEITNLAETPAGAVAYLRGNASAEKRNQGKLRDRTTALGDIINSSPVLSSPIDDYGYRRLPGAVGTSYADYLATKRNDRRYMVYAGANDGMLHAFDGGMGAAGSMDSEGGKEVFAYIPSTSLGHMGDLLLPYDPNNENTQRFQHRYFVDGPTVVGDTYGSDGWTTTLVGTSGAGGRSVFALDVSDPTNFGASGTLLWEISDLNEGLDETVRDNIGFVLGKPVIVPTRAADGSISFKAIFGNGFESRNGRAVLFVVDLVAGTSPTIRMIEATESGTNLPAGNNGLGNIVVVDRWGGDDQDQRVRDGFADTVYGADKKGAVWKFDLRSDTAPARPLFTTSTHQDAADGLTYRQPITGGLTATAGASGGVMLIFGTGSFAYYGDEQSTVTQALYGVNDTGSDQPATTLTAADLQPYTVETGAGGRTLAAGTRPNNSRGWTVTLPAGERAVGNPLVTSGIVFMPTYVPSETEGCSVDGSNWLFGLQANSGISALSQVRFGSPDGEPAGAGTASVALDTGGNAPVRDVTAAVVPRLAPPENSDPSTGPPDPPAHACMMQVSVAGADPMYLPYPCGRQSWRQIQ